jgi:hypothetical protein
VPRSSTRRVLFVVAPVAVAGAVVVAGLGLRNAGDPAPGTSRVGSTSSVAYVRGTDSSVAAVWMANLDGSHPRRLGGGSQPLLAPDGSLVAATQDPGIVVYPASGELPHRYYSLAHATAVAKAFSPDSRYVVVALTSTNPTSSAASGLAVIDTTTFSERIIAHGQIYGASFAPDGSQRIAYASAASPALTEPVNVHVVRADGSGAAQITHDGRSLNPIWGPGVIAFDRERLRSQAEPAYQVWDMASDGSGRRPLTTMAIPPLREGLMPIAFSQDGSRLLAEYEGQDTSEAWLLALPSGHAAPLGSGLTAAALSHDHASVLVDRGGFLSAPDHGVVESIPLTGGPNSYLGPTAPPRVLFRHGSDPSWNA